jgi:proline iminopeptidase
MEKSTEGFPGGKLRRKTAIARLAVGVAVIAITLQGLGEKNSETLGPGDHYAQVGDVRLHYKVAGSGPLLIVCSPGWGISARYLETGLKPLQEKFKVLYLDTRGSGASSRPVDSAKMSGADMADDIEHLRIALGLHEIFLLGHSDSGSIVLDYAERYPASVSRMIFVDGIAFGSGPADQQESAQQEQLMKAAAGDPRYKSAVEAMSRNPVMTDEGMKQYLGEIISVYFANTDRLPDFLNTMGDTKPSSWAWQYHNKANQNYPWRQEQRLGEVRARTLIIVGKQDRICVPLIAEHVHAGIRDSRLLEIDDSGHFPWIEQPKQFFEAVNQFLH